MKLTGISQRMAKTDFANCGTVSPMTGISILQALGVHWAAIPNDPDQAPAYGKALALTGIILTGGDDCGLFPQRDATELALLDWAKSDKVPVIGVCRGLQIINRWLGGGLAPADQSRHRGQRHGVRYGDGRLRVVNSYHNHVLEAAPALLPLALDAEDGSLEAACAENMLGVMWHPEREKRPAEEDLALFRSHLGLNHL